MTLQFTPHEPAFDGARFVTAMFHMKDFMPDHSMERVVPTGHAYLIIELDGFVRSTFDPETHAPREQFSGAWLAGLHRHHLAISAHEHSEMLVVQFQPFGLRPFLHAPADTAANCVVAASEAFDPDIIALRERLLGHATAAEKLAEVDVWLGKRFDATLAPSHDFITFVDDLASAPDERFQRMLRRYPRSNKHLIDQFKLFVGLTPKYFHRILRLQEVLQRASAEKPMSWTDLAYATGMSDQSHFIREFRHFTGYSPSEFKRMGFDIDATNFFPLDRSDAPSDPD